MAPDPPAGEVLAPAEARRLLGDGLDLEAVGVLAGRPLLALSVADGASGELAAVAPLLGRLPAVVVAVASRPLHVPAGFDVLLCDSDGAPAPWVSCPHGTGAALATLSSSVAAQPEAAVVLVELLRCGAAAGWDVEGGLLAESLAYATLQGGPGFRAWLGGRSSAAGPSDMAAGSRDPVRIERDGDDLVVILDRPHVHNALDTAMRDALVEALAVAGADAGLRTVHLRGAGASFSSGGDLSEFGSVPDPVTGHLVRMSRSPARTLAALGAKVVAHVHGAVAGAGLELAAFAGRVEAEPDATFWLPELAFGLVPGSGGTVSVPRRIGAARAAWLALTGSRLDAAGALAWGLVDEIVGGRG